MPASIPVYTLYKKKNERWIGVDSLASVKVEILSEAHVVVVCVDVLAPAIEKLMQVVSIVLAATTS